jgi:hypothetical protein
MRLLSILMACCLIGFTACDDHNTTTTIRTSDTIHAAAKEPASSKLEKTGTTLIMSVVSRYYDLKNALVVTKAASADSAARQLVVTTEILQRYFETDTAQRSYILPYLDTILTQARAISVLNDETCEKQRIAFGHISSAIYGLAKNAGLKNAGIYHEYCPMAFNDKGAYWLSNEAEIKNPYFGKKMLECGEVTDSL